MTGTIRTVITFCKACDVRHYPVEKHLDNCVYCNAFPCNKLDKLNEQTPEAKNNLIKIKKV
jgi:hypothetical protein